MKYTVDEEAEKCGQMQYYKVKKRLHQFEHSNKNVNGESYGPEWSWSIMGEGLDGRKSVIAERVSYYVVDVMIDSLRAPGKKFRHKKINQPN